MDLLSKFGAHKNCGKGVDDPKICVYQEMLWVYLQNRKYQFTHQNKIKHGNLLFWKSGEKEE